jgi:hypothetical protein
LRYNFDLDIELLRSPSGEQVFGVYISSAPQIVRLVIGFSRGQLASQQNDAVTIRIVFMFHQTSQKIVDIIMRALRQLPNNQEWQQLPYEYTKHLRVDPVVLLSCESGMDKGFQPGPEPAGQRQLSLRRYAAQATKMRKAAGEAFITPMAPPPTDPLTFYDPGVMTFSTGDADTGGIELNPFGCRFRKLPGRFRDDGSWDYDPTPPGQDPDSFHSGTPASGTVHIDHVNQGSSTSQPIPAGQSFSIIP